MRKLLKKLIPDLIFYWYHWKLAFLAALVYGFSSRKLKVIGVTGTKGKSTVVMLAGRILEEGGHKIGWISSLSIKAGDKEWMNPYHMTMPGRFFIQKTLRQMVKNGCEFAIVVVSSEGIKQHRHRFIKWAGAVFTNLAPEHIEAHGSFEKYRAAKLKLFTAAAKNKESFGVYNFDDENAEWFLKAGIKNKIVYGKSLRGAPHLRGGAAIPRDCRASLAMTDIRLFASGSEFEINDIKFKTNLLGEFNVYNCAAAATIGLACGVPLEASKQSLERVKSIPGRLEIIDEGQNFTVVVDLAHTPDSFAKVFGLFRGLPYGHIISVFGSAGGGRDKWKRPELGRIASENSDVVIITNEDPYDELPEQIAKEIVAGCQKTQPEIILDRREAIAKTLSLAQAGDAVLILGKGTEQTMVIGGKKIEWDDRAITREELKKIKTKNQSARL